jgi:hypothetical protein
MKIGLGYFNARVERRDILKPTVGNESLHETSNDNVGIVLNLPLNFQGYSVPISQHSEIHLEFSCWGTHSHIDATLTDKRRHSNVVDIRLYGGVDCGTDRYVVIAKSYRDCH